MERSTAAMAAAGVALVVGVLLSVQLTSDPIVGFTFSYSPFTDEGWSVLGARNQALLGSWSTDEWQLFWAQLPFNVAVLAAFEAAGVGIVQARSVSIGCSVLAVALVTYWLVRRTGIAAGVVGGLALGTSTLYLFYGRLALLEPMVVLFLVAGFGLLILGGPRGTAAGGVVAGACFALAIGTKPSAALAVTGIIVATAITGSAVPGLRRRSGIAAAVIAGAAMLWVAIVVPQPGLLDVILQIWPQQDLPGSLGVALERVLRYVRNSDGALVLAAPLLVGGAAGATIAALSWSRLPPVQRAAVGAAIGWIVVGWGILLIVPYRPNRYVVQLLPPLAVLLAVGLAALLPRIVRLAPAWRAALIVGVVVALGAPGAASVTRWTSQATHRLPDIQSRVLELVTDGRPIEGGPVPTLGMRVPAPAIVTRLVNQGDVYERYGVRWLLIGPGAQPAWAADHPEAWAAREVIECFAWGPGKACLVRLPDP